MKLLRKLSNAKKPATSSMLASTSRELGLALDDIVIVFACSENFVPYFSVAAQSIVENADPARHYDIIVLTRDISPTSIMTLSRQIQTEHTCVGFLDVDAALGDRQLPHYGHFRPETYFRLLAPSLLTNVDKALYLDSDLIVHDDVAKLFDIDVQGYPLAATRDADTIGQIAGYDPSVGPYLKHQLGMDNPYDYFQAGVLLMNLAYFREHTTPEQLLSIATERMWHWLDQDVLNKVVNGDYKRVDMRWNYLVDWMGLRKSAIVAEAPQAIRDAYAAAAQNPAIIHFAGPDNRPWLYPTSDCADLFWYYARKSPYVEEMRAQLEESRASAAGLAKRAQVLLAFKAGMPMFNRLCPPGSQRRATLINTYHRLSNLNNE